MNVELPDGTVLEDVPDGTTKVQLIAKLKKNGYDAQPLFDQLVSERQEEARQAVVNDMSTAEKFFAGAGKAVTDIGRGTAQIIGLGDQETVDESRGLDAPLMETTAGKVGNVAGNVAVAAPAAFVPGANTLVGASLTGAALGAAQPTVEGESRLANTAVGTVAGAGGYGLGKAIGAGVNAAKGKVARVAAQKAAAPAKVPELDELKTLANAAYTKAENAGVVVSKNSFRRALYSIKKEVTDEGLDKTLHPKATAALNRLSESAGKKLSLKELDTLRRVVKGAAASIEPDERRIARIMVDKLDDYMTSLKPSDVVSGDAKAATEALGEARNLWSRFRKGEIVEDLIARAKNRSAQFSGSGYENALRTEFRNLAQNAKRMRGFTQQEQKSIRLVARGGPVENALRFLGKFAPTGTISTLLGGGAGYAIGGPVGGAAILGAGAAGRVGAKLLTSRNAKASSELMRSGGALPVKENPLVSLAVSQLPNLQRAPQTLGILAPSISTSNR